MAGIVRNAHETECCYLGLEPDESDNYQDWETGGSVLSSEIIYTGKYSAYCSTEEDCFGPTKNISYNDLGLAQDPQSKFVFSAAVKVIGNNNCKMVIELRNGGGGLINDPPDSKTIYPSEGWQVVEMKTPSLSALPTDGYVRIWCGAPAIGSACYIDELRFYPNDALMSTYTYDHVTGNLISVADENSRRKSFEYDGLGRLVAKKNDRDEKVGNAEYHMMRGCNAVLYENGFENGQDQDFTPEMGSSVSRMDYGFESDHCDKIHFPAAIGYADLTDIPYTTFFGNSFQITGYYKANDNKDFHLSFHYEPAGNSGYAEKYLGKISGNGEWQNFNFAVKLPDYVTSYTGMKFRIKTGQSYSVSEVKIDKISMCAFDDYKPVNISPVPLSTINSRDVTFVWNCNNSPSFGKVRYDLILEPGGIIAWYTPGQTFTKTGLGLKDDYQWYVVAKYDNGIEIKSEKTKFSLVAANFFPLRNMRGEIFRYIYKDLFNKIHSTLDEEQKVAFAVTYPELNSLTHEFAYVSDYQDQMTTGACFEYRCMHTKFTGDDWSGWVDEGSICGWTTGDTDPSDEMHRIGIRIKGIVPIIPEIKLEALFKKAFSDVWNHCHWGGEVKCKEDNYSIRKIRCTFLDNPPGYHIWYRVYDRKNEKSVWATNGQQVGLWGEKIDWFQIVIFQY